MLKLLIVVVTLVMNFMNDYEVHIVREGNYHYVYVEEVDHFFDTVENPIAKVLKPGEEYDPFFD